MNKGNIGLAIIAAGTLGGLLLGGLLNHPIWGLIIGLIWSLLLSAPFLEAESKEVKSALASRYGDNIQTFAGLNYLGGHPEVRTTYVAGTLIVGEDFVAYLNGLRRDAIEVFKLRFTDIGESGYSSDVTTLTTWASDMPFTISETKEKNKMVYISFINDIGEVSTLGLSGPNDLKDLAQKLEYAIYDWKKGQKSSNG